MKGWVVPEYKQPLELTEVPEPSVGAHDALLAIDAAAVNLIDVKLQAASSSRSCRTRPRSSWDTTCQAR